MKLVEFKEAHSERLVAVNPQHVEGLTHDRLDQETTIHFTSGKCAEVVGSFHEVWRRLTQPGVQE